MKTKEQHWTKTVAAAKAEESSAWSMIWAMAEEAYDRDPDYKNISSGRVIEEIRLELEEAGVSLKFNVIKERALVGKMVHGADKRDRDVLRSVPWTVIREAVNYSATAEAVAEVIRDSRTRNERPTAEVMRDAFSLRPQAEDGDESDSSSAKFTDAHYMAALATIAAHTMAERRGEYTPSPMARLAGSLLGEMLVGKVAVVDWDAQLTELIDAQDGE